MMRFHYNIACLACLTIFFCPARQLQAFPGKYPVKNFTPAEYKAGIQNIDFAQNRDMTLFVANNLGVLSFNGNEWNTHDFKTGKKKRSLAFDEAADRLYVGSQGEFGYFEKDWQYVSLVEKIPSARRDFDEVWDVFLLNAKAYFCTFQGIYVYDGQTISVIENEGGFERSFLANGKLFTQDQNGKLYHIEDMALREGYPQTEKGQIIAGVVAQEEGYLLFYNSGQIEFTTTFGVRPRYEDLRRALQGTYVNHVLQLSDTRLAISTQTSGLFLYDLQSGNLETITSQDGLESNACLRSFQDYFGNLWLGMQNGIAIVYINSPLRLLNRDINLQGSGYEAIETAEGAYFTTSNGIYYLARGARQSVFLPGTEGPAYGMQEIAGRYYAGHHTGLLLLENGAAKRIANTEGLWMVRPLRSRPGYAVGGTYAGLYLFRIDEKQMLQPLGKISGFSASSRFFEEDAQGRIWVGQYYKGLYRLTLSDDLTKVSVANISEGSELPINEQIVLSRVQDELYLATNSGLYVLDAATGAVAEAAPFSRQIGRQPVYLLAQDRRNYVHVITEQFAGFFKQISAGNYLFVPSSLYQLRYHLNNDLLHTSLNTDHGVLFSANEGFILYNPQLEVPLDVNKPLVVSRVFSVNQGRTLYARKPFEVRPENIESLEVSPGAKVLKIDVESFQFNDPGNQQFRYFLKGFDEDYGPWTNAAAKEYTNLTEGKYEFTVQTQNYLGEITTSQPLYLIVHPPFYKSLPAKVLYVLLGLAALLLVLRFQKHRYKQKTIQLEETRRMELAKEQQKLVEIEQQKEKELIQLRTEKMQSELQHVNKLLAASTMNLVVKNEFIESIREEIKEVRQKGKKLETRQALEKIVKEIDITLRLQEDWEQFEHHFEMVHGDFLTRLRSAYPDLSPNEQKLCAFLRLNLNTKEIANLLSISLRGVEVARYRLRRKLELEQGQNLSKFILEY